MENTKIENENVNNEKLVEKIKKLRDLNLLIHQALEEISELDNRTAYFSSLTIATFAIGPTWMHGKQEDKDSIINDLIISLKRFEENVNSEFEN